MAHGPLRQILSILDSSVVTAKLADLAVTTAKIADLAITTAKLAAGAVTGPKLWTAPRCAVYHNANQSITNNTNTVLAFNSERWDTDGMHDTVTNNSRVTATTAGLYIIHGLVFWDGGSSVGLRDQYLRVNGATIIAEKAVPPAGTNVTAVTFGTDWYLNAGDYVELLVYQNSGGSLNVLFQNAYSPDLRLVWVTN